MLLNVAQPNPRCQILVLFGHTHGGGEIQVAEHLPVGTGPAECGRREIQQVLDVTWSR